MKVFKFIGKCILRFVLFVWQLPQDLVGIILYVYHKCFCKHKEGICKNTKYGVTVFVAKHVNDCGVSLGDFIFLDSDTYHNENDYKHEHGHQIQSLCLGWFYLFVIGIPSAIHNVIYTKQEKQGKQKESYYSFYCEKWADKWGKVKRDYNVF